MRMDRDYKKIFIIGGHITPALAIIDEIKQRFPKWEIVFIGRKYNLENAQIESEEGRLIKAKNIRFLTLVSGRINRQLGLNTIVSLLKIPLGFVTSVRYLVSERPDLIISFGGYLAVPVVLTGWFWGVPCVTHEQTSKPGLANRFIGLFAKRIYESVPRSFSKFFSNKTIFTGLPLRKEIIDLNSTKRYINFRDKLPLILITGGTTGAVSLNEIIFSIIDKLLVSHNLIHQTGRISYDKAVRIRNKLPSNLHSRYFVTPYLDTDFYSWALHQARMVISRSGANTVAELTALSKVAILIPLPWSAEGEQEANARSLAACGAALIIKQSDLTSERLEEAVAQVNKNYDKYSRSSKNLAKKIPLNVARAMVADIAKTLPKEH